MQTIDFTINNDEIEKISKRVHELQTLLKKDLPSSDELIDEYSALLELKDLLFRANQIDDENAFIVVDGMRIERSKVNRFKELLKRVNVIGLATMPNYLGDILPGTKYKMPRQKNSEETFEEYEDYLFNYYKKLGYVFENTTYHPGTKVPVLRNPYPHEMYYPSENGFVYDEDFLGNHNEYYQEYRKYLEEKLALEYQKIVLYAIENFTIFPPIGKDINKRKKVTNTESFTLFLNIDRKRFRKKKSSNSSSKEYSPLVKALHEQAKILLNEHESKFEKKPLEELKPNLKVDINIPENLKNALDRLPSNNYNKVIDVSISPNKLIGRAKDMLTKNLAKAITEYFDVVGVTDGFYLYKMVPKDILIGNALSKRTIKDKRIAYEIASKFRRLMSEDSALSHYHDMMLKSFLEVNKEVTPQNEEAITEENMRIK